jgi:hypothetical protein
MDTNLLFSNVLFTMSEKGDRGQDKPSTKRDWRKKKDIRKQNKRHANEDRRQAAGLANFVVRETRDISEEVAGQPPPPPPPHPRREVDVDFVARNIEASILRGGGNAKVKDAGLEHDSDSVMGKYTMAIQTQLSEELTKGDDGNQAQWLTPFLRNHDFWIRAECSKKICVQLNSPTKQIEFERPGC